MSTYDNNYGILKATAKALINKKQIPHHTLGLLTDPYSFHAAVVNYGKETIKTYHCSNCGLDIKAPREWARAHHKGCVDSIHKLRENEQLISKFNPYWY